MLVYRKRLEYRVDSKCPSPQNDLNNPKTNAKGLRLISGLERQIFSEKKITVNCFKGLFLCI